MAQSAGWLSMAGSGIPVFATMRPLGQLKRPIPAQIGLNEAPKLLVRSLCTNLDVR